MSTFADRLTESIRRCGNPVVVGLDPRKASLPDGLLPTSWGDEVDAIAQAYRTFCNGVIDVVAPLVPAVKPQVAFFEQLGPAGMRVLRQVVKHAREQGLLVIIDGKRNDIGSTAEAYADAHLGPESPWKGDALTVSPYLGADSLEPFFKVANERVCGLFVLVKTSNPGGGMLQDLVANGRPLYQHVAEYVQSLNAETMGQSGYGTIGAVVGATYPDQLAELRGIMPNAYLLIPGFGSQGGTAADVAGGFDDSGLGAIVNSSRGIIFAHSRPEYEKYGDAKWQQAVEAATRDMIEQLRANTNVGKL
jgi:orotidine-5'-phosphate decarboxylase